MRRWPLRLLIVALPSLLPAATTLERAETVRQASGLGSVSCDLDPSDGIPAWFRYRPGSPYVAETAILLPVAYDDVARRVVDLEGYPEWLLLDRGGRPTLGPLTVAEDRRSGRLRLRPKGEAYLEGSVAILRDAEATGLRLQAQLEGAIKEATFEATVFPVAGCDDRTLVVMRADWRLGFLARTFGGQRKGLPALLLLAVRADLLAATVQKPERLLGRADGDVGPVARVLPVRIQLAEDRFVPLDRVVQRGSERSGRVDADEVFETLLTALDGRHDLVGYWVWFEVDGEVRFATTGNDRERSVMFFVMNGRDGLSLNVMP